MRTPRPAMTCAIGLMWTSRVRQGWLVAAALLVLAGASERPASGQVGTACDCPDVFDLINRLNMAEAAVTALQGELPKVQAADTQAGKTSSMADRNAAGQTNQDVLRGVINEAMSHVQMLGGRTSRGETGGLCGSSVEASSTACMDEIVMFHEDNVHVRACAADRTAGRTTALGFRAPQTTVDYVKEEIAGYQAEITRIRQILRTLPASCRQTGWVGVIIYTENKSIDVATSVNNPKNGSSSSTQSLSTLTRVARVLFRGAGAKTGNTYLKEVMTLRQVGTGPDSCKAGLATPTVDTMVTGTVESITEITGTGESEVTAAVDFDARTGRTTLSFEIPGLVGEGTLKQTESLQGACNPAANVTKTSPGASFSQPYETSQLSVDGVSARGLDVLRGSKSLDLGPSVAGVAGLTTSHRAQVTWALYRLQ